MAAKRPATIPQYIAAAPPAGQSHLRKLYAILKSVAPDAEETIKRNTPFFVEPRFLLSFSGHKTHCNFAPSEKALHVFSKGLEPHQTTKNFLRIAYNQPMPKN